MHVRLKLLLLFFLAFFFLLTFRLFTWQIIKGGELSSQARSQHQSGRRVFAPRGNILASDGSFLAARADSWLVSADIPDFKKSPEEIADQLAPLFTQDPSDKNATLEEWKRILGLLSKKEVVWMPLKHKVSNQVKKNIEALGISGLGFELEETRVYPEASSSAHTLGFVGKTKEGQDQGYFGLEGYYDFILSGKQGFSSTEKDAKGAPILLHEGSDVSAIKGVNLITHIDKAVQRVIEEKLKQGIERYGAKGGSVILMNPKDGAILGMASFPSYDPGKYWEYGDEYFKNPVVSNTFEPGSVFKVLIMASALDAKAVTPDTNCDICQGPLKVDKYTIETWNKEYHPDSTMTDVIVNSDNVGMAFVAQKLERDKLYDYLNAFGIGRLTGIDLQGEGATNLRDKGTWNVVDLVTAGFGQGVAVTPIEMARAVSAIANGGNLVTPQVVAKLKGDGWEEEIKPKVEGRVIGIKAAKEVTEMMVAAAKNGEAKWTDTAGFSVAGKTGTAQIPIEGHYDKEKTIASFVGFSPAEDAKFVMLVSLKEPTSSPWGSETAAPLWYSIAKELFPYFGIQPNF